MGTLVNACLILRNWGCNQYGPPACGRRSILHPQFLRISVRIFRCALARLTAFLHFCILSKSNFTWQNAKKSFFPNCGFRQKRSFLRISDSFTRIFETYTVLLGRNSDYVQIFLGVYLDFNKPNVTKISQKK